eukprot:TRINITY_DN11025_c0_g2_i1.p1 TRINITY_DN11025_c0_g2~~TRINITY_DN11025_c0_g2_i1.p1  ORF type:complete len:485 (+),score=133.87 TRINITY_DN11025_c0_g2_i1:54-1457(+)
MRALSPRQGCGLAAVLAGACAALLSRRRQLRQPTQQRPTQQRPTQQRPVRGSPAPGQPASPARPQPGGDVYGGGAAFPTGGVWNVRSDPPRFTPRAQGGAQPVRLANSSALRGCLSGRRVAFVGDSVMRYLYMTVMYWVETGDLSVPRVSDMLNDFLSKPPSELQREHMPPLVPHPGVAYSHEWGDGSWADYYWEGQRSFGGKMCCDCLRTDAGGRELPVRQQRENRYYSGGAGLDSAFFFMHGDHLVSGGKVGHTPGCFTGQLGGGRPCTKTGQPVPVHPRCDYAHGGAQIWLHDAMWIAEKPVWRGHPPAAIATQLMNYGVDALVVGVGLWQEWGAWSADPARAWTGMESLDRSLRPNGTALWLSWPAKCRGKDPGKEELVRRWVARRSPRWRVLDTALVTASLRRHLGCDPHRCPGWDQRSRSDPRLFPHCAVAWVDDVGHFQPWVYHEMAQLLYNALGCASTA